MAEMRLLEEIQNGYPEASTKAHAKDGD